MARACELTGKKVQYGHMVSHSNIKTNRRFEPNLQVVSLYSEALKKSISMRISAHALRSVEHNGGLDSFLLTAKSHNLPLGAQKLKRLVKKAAGAPAAAAPKKAKKPTAVKKTAAKKAKAKKAE